MGQAALCVEAGKRNWFHIVEQKQIRTERTLFSLVSFPNYVGHVIGCVSEGAGSWTTIRGLIHVYHQVVWISMEQFIWRRLYMATCPPFDRWLTCEHVLPLNDDFVMFSLSLVRSFRLFPCPLNFWWREEVVAGIEMAKSVSLEQKWNNLSVLSIKTICDGWLYQSNTVNSFRLLFADKTQGSLTIRVNTRPYFIHKQRMAVLFVCWFGLLQLGSFN